MVVATAGGNIEQAFQSWGEGPGAAVETIFLGRTCMSYQKARLPQALLDT
jgi:hypothetical protein